MKVLVKQITRFVGIALLVFGCMSAAAGTPAATQPSAASLVPIQDPHLPNARRVNEKLICGGQPEGTEGFARLQAMGVKTIISVDGIKPNVELAYQFGMRYVHLPFGYDAVPKEQGQAIAKAIDELPGPIYIHCHHGKHRSPAAAAVACVYNGMLQPSEAEALLAIFGTGDRPVDPKTLAELKVDFVETAKIPPLADAMVNVDRAFDSLKLMQKAGWKASPAHADWDPSHAALQLEELLQEIGRSDSVKSKPDDFKHRLGEAQQAARSLEDALSARRPATAAMDAALKEVANSCAACHKDYRD
jgi:protein tyrosine phosphatase (PTP) superfamily phosphohydrolase (DUF442 family)/cytochrome c556